MPKKITPLSDIEIKKAKAKDKDYKLSDGGGLYLLVTTSGGKLWRMDYRLNDKRKTIILKSYPEISLSDARQRRDDARKLIANGIDPNELKKSQKAQEQIQADIEVNTFEKVAREWHGFNHNHNNENGKKWSDSHAKKLMKRLENDVFPFIGNKQIADIERTELVVLLRRVAERTIETAIRIKIAFCGVFRLAYNTGMIKHNPAIDFKDVIPQLIVKHMAAPTDPKAVTPLLRAIDGFEGHFVVRSALKLAPMLFVRPGELRAAEWSEIDFEAKEWNIPAHKMKMKKPHLVPLPSQAIEILKRLQELTGNGKYLFPCHRSILRCMSENTINASLRRLGFGKDEITGHGFRAMARTMLDEILGFRPEIIEHQLAHAVKDALGNAYNRTSHLQERKKMMQTWADYLDGLKADCNVIPLPVKAA